MRAALRGITDRSCFTLAFIAAMPGRAAQTGPSDALLSEMALLALSSNTRRWQRYTSPDTAERIVLFERLISEGIPRLVQPRAGKCERIEVSACARRIVNTQK